MAVARELSPGIDASQIHRGMTVVNLNGDRIGTVTDVLAYIHGYGYLAKSGFELASYGPVRGTSHHFDGADGYVQVRQGTGMPRENEPVLLIPIDEIHDAIPSDCLILDHTAESATAQFAAR